MNCVFTQFADAARLAGGAALTCAGARNYFHNDPFGGDGEFRALVLNKRRNQEHETGKKIAAHNRLL